MTVRKDNLHVFGLDNLVNIWLYVNAQEGPKRIHWQWLSGT